jgi:hypothetical protein
MTRYPKTGKGTKWTAKELDSITSAWVGDMLNDSESMIGDVVQSQSGSISIKFKFGYKLDKKKMRELAQKKEQEEMQALILKNQEIRARNQARKEARDKQNLLAEQRFEIENFKPSDFKNRGKTIMRESAQLKKIMENLLEKDEMPEDIKEAKLSFADILKDDMPSIKNRKEKRNYKQVEFKPSFKNVLKKGELLKEPFAFEKFYKEPVKKLSMDDFKRVKNILRKEPVKKLSMDDFERVKKDFGKNILRKEEIKLKPSDFTRSKNKFVETAIDTQKMKDIKKWIDKETDKYNYRDIKDLEPRTAQPWDYDDLVEYKRKLNLLKRQMKKNK